jgi:hypothetical protein
MMACANVTNLLLARANLRPCPAARPGQSRRKNYRHDLRPGSGLSVSIHVISDLSCDGNQFIEYRYDIVNSSFPFTQLIASPDHGDPTHQLLASYVLHLSYPRYPKYYRI